MLNTMHPLILCFFWTDENSNIQTSYPNGLRYSSLEVDKVRQKENPKSEIVPIPVDESIRKKYTKTKRFNVIFPEYLLVRVDEYRASAGMKRSQLLADAADQYLEAQA